MKNILTLLILVITAQLFSQNKADSIIAQLERAKNEKEGIEALNGVVHLFYPENNEQSKKMALQVLAHLKKKGDEMNADRLESFIASFLIYSGDYNGALQMSLPLLDKVSKRKDTIGIYDAYQNIADAYMYSRNYDDALVNYHKIVDFAKVQNDKSRLAAAYNMIGYTYSKKNLSDSGLVYTQKAMNAAKQANDEWIVKYILSTTAENYIANKDYNLAVPFLRKSLREIHNANTYDTSIIVVYNDFAQAFLGLKIYDSVNHYSQKAIEVARSMDWKDEILRSYQYLYQSFEQTHQPDSTYKYFRLATTLKDSLFDMEKLKSIESISFQQQLKEQEEKLKFEKLEAERQHTIQFALLAIGIISFIIIFLLLSRSIITNTKIIKFLSIVALLMVFEFLNLILHPFLERITHHSPILMLSALVCIAALLVPLHHKIEHWAVHKLVEKNRQIRLAAAKRTIEQLETKLDQ